MDRPQTAEIELIPDTCSCGRGKLHKGITKYITEVEDRVIVISNVPAWMCDLCSETYVSPDVWDKIDEIIAAFRAGKLLAKPLAAGQVELALNA
jgi:YgiT-type zinc finger domain-containing protein